MRWLVADNQTPEVPLLWAYRGKVGFLFPMKDGYLSLQRRRVAAHRQNKTMRLSYSAALCALITNIT